MDSNDNVAIPERNLQSQINALTKWKNDIGLPALQETEMLSEQNGKLEEQVLIYKLELDHLSHDLSAQQQESDLLVVQKSSTSEELKLLTTLSTQSLLQSQQLQQSLSLNMNSVQNLQQICGSLRLKIKELENTNVNLQAINEKHFKNYMRFEIEQKRAQMTIANLKSLVSQQKKEINVLLSEQMQQQQQQQQQQSNSNVADTNSDSNPNPNPNIYVNMNPDPTPARVAGFGLYLDSAGAVSSSEDEEVDGGRVSVSPVRKRRTFEPGIRSSAMDDRGDGLGTMTSAPIRYQPLIDWKLTSVGLFDGHQQQQSAGPGAGTGLYDKNAHSSAFTPKLLYQPDADDAAEFVYLSFEDFTSITSPTTTAKANENTNTNTNAKASTANTNMTQNDNGHDEPAFAEFNIAEIQHDLRQMSQFTEIRRLNANLEIAQSNERAMQTEIQKLEEQMEHLKRIAYTSAPAPATTTTMMSTRSQITEEDEVCACNNSICVQQ